MRNLLEMMALLRNFSKRFCLEKEKYFYNVFCTISVKKLYTSQRQAVIKLVGKKRKKTKIKD